MLASGEPSATGLVPLLRYRNVAAAVEWLCTAFGVETDALVTGDDNSVIYAQLVWGPSIIMIVSVGQSHLDGLMRQPEEVGGAETQGCYLVVADVEKHYARAKAAGAEIVLEMVGGEIGRRGYSCRDPEGHIWSFGTYDPFQGRPLRRDTVVDRSRVPTTIRSQALGPNGRIGSNSACPSGGHAIVCGRRCRCFPELRCGVVPKSRSGSCDRQDPRNRTRGNSTRAGRPGRCRVLCATAEGRVSGRALGKRGCRPRCGGGRGSACPRV